MRTLSIILVIFICNSNLAQDISKWQCYLSKDIDYVAKNERFLMATNSNAKSNNLKIIKKLDDFFCIVDLKNTNNDLKELFVTNNLWKLSSNFCNDKKLKKYLLNTDDSESLKKDLEILSIKINKSVTDKIFIIECDSERILEQIISLQEVCSVTLESLNPVFESKISDQNFSINNINKANAFYSNIKGQNQIVSIKDEFYDVNDIDLLNKHIVTTTQSSVVSNHASNMSTIVSGLGNSSILGKGVAKEAKIQFSNFLNIFLDDISTISETRIQNHSYGTQIENFYGFLANSYDTQLHLNPEMIHCFSSGNKGFEGFKTITGNFKQSKNSIVVGAVDQNEMISSFSSKGPAFDGRVKPEVVAFSSQGTSNSTAITTGVLTLMKQHYKALFNSNLKNDLAKSILINSCKDLGNIGPDYTYGYGNIDAYKSLKTISESKFLQDNITSNQIKNHVITIPNNVKYLKITLVWNDLPSTINNSTSLVNDLDLEVAIPTSTSYLPYILNPDLPLQVATLGKDHINNIEQVKINNPLPGQVNISILGTTITNSLQQYAIAYEYELENNFEWNYPILNDNFPYDGKIISPFKWNSNYLNTSGKLEISYDNGLTWQIISNDVSLQSGQFSFYPQEELFSKAKLKMTIGNTNYISDDFIVSYDLNINTILVCNNDTEIVWNRPNQISSFNIYKLVGSEMLFKEQVTSSNYVYSGDGIYAVSAVFENSEGIKSESTLKNLPNSNCYFKSIIAEEVENSKIKINTALFTKYGIKNLELQKVKNTSSTTIKTINDVNELEFDMFDENPDDGINKYRIDLTLIKDDFKVSSEIFSCYYFGEQNFLIYPTILNNSQSINIEIKTAPLEKITFTVYSLIGYEVFSADINSQKSSHNINNLSTGTYIYKIETTKGEKKVGKIIIL